MEEDTEDGEEALEVDGEVDGEEEVSEEEALEEADGVEEDGEDHGGDTSLICIYIAFSNYFNKFFKYRMEIRQY